MDILTINALFYIVVIIASVMLLLFGVGAFSLHFFHKRLCAVFQKQIEIEKMQVELKFEMQNRNTNSIFH